MNTSCLPDRRRSRAIPPGAKTERRRSWPQRGTRGSRKSFCAFCAFLWLIPCPLFPHRPTVNLLAPQVNFVNLPGIGNILQRVRVEHNEVGALAGRDHAELIE